MGQNCWGRLHWKIIRGSNGLPSLIGIDKHLAVSRRKPDKGRSVLNLRIQPGSQSRQNHNNRGFHRQNDSCDAKSPDLYPCPYHKTLPVKAGC